MTLEKIEDDDHFLFTLHAAQAIQFYSEFYSNKYIN